MNRPKVLQAGFLARKIVGAYRISGRRDIVICEAPHSPHLRGAARVEGPRPLKTLSSRISLLEDPNQPVTQLIQRLEKRVKAFPYRCGKPFPAAREKVVVLGTGWASLYFLNQIDPTKYDVTVVSPRPFFVFTPLLTAALGGVLSARSLMEPIRNKLVWGGRKTMEYLDGRADDIDFSKREVTCRDNEGAAFTVPFDKVVCCIGSETNTFGIPGVVENASFLKEVEDAREIRLKILHAFEKASIPSTSPDDIRALLHFVVVGGGPAGVEAAAEVADMIREDMTKYYPTLTPLAKVSIIEMLPKLIPMFGSELSQYTLRNFEKMGVNCMMETRVVKIDNKNICVVDKANKEFKLPYGTAIWASGVGQVDFAKKLMNKIPAQKGNRVIRVTPDLKIIGSDRIYALGDCAWVTPPKLQDKVDDLYEVSDTPPLSTLSQAASQCPTGAGISWLHQHANELLRQNYVQLHPTQCDYAGLKPKDNLSKKDFASLLSAIDAAYKPPIPTAQMARQAGSYLGAVLNQRRGPRVIPYWPTTYGHMSYVGAGRAVAELVREKHVPKPKTVKLMGGTPVNLLWHSYYWLSQTSKTNRTLSLIDYMKKAIRGRDMAEQSLSSTAARAASEAVGFSPVGASRRIEELRLKYEPNISPKSGPALESIEIKASPPPEGPRQDSFTDYFGGRLSLEQSFGEDLFTDVKSEHPDAGGDEAVLEEIILPPPAKVESKRKLFGKLAMAFSKRRGRKQKADAPVEEFCDAAHIHDTRPINEKKHRSSQSEGAHPNEHETRRRLSQKLELLRSETATGARREKEPERAPYRVMPSVDFTQNES